MSIWVFECIKGMIRISMCEVKIRFCIKIVVAKIKGKKEKREKLGWYLIVYDVSVFVMLMSLGLKRMISLLLNSVIKYLCILMLNAIKIHYICD